MNIYFIFLVALFILEIICAGSAKGIDDKTFLRCFIFGVNVLFFILWNNYSLRSIVVGLGIMFFFFIFVLCDSQKTKKSVAVRLS
jgi:hypothetical protein